MKRSSRGLYLFPYREQTMFTPGKMQWVGTYPTYNEYGIQYLGLHITKYRSIKCIPRVSQFLSPRPNWDHPQPLSRKRVRPSPPEALGGGGGTLAYRSGGWGSPNSDGWRKSLALCLLCATYAGLRLVVHADAAHLVFLHDEKYLFKFQISSDSNVITFFGYITKILNAGQWKK